MNLFNDRLRRLNRDKLQCIYVNNSVYDAFNYCLEEFLFRIENLALKLDNVSNILEIGCRNGILTERLAGVYSNAHITVSEISEKLAQKTMEKFSQRDNFNVICCPESLTFDNIYAQNFDLIVSMLNIHWINDIFGWFKSAKLSLKPSGKIICSFLGGNTLLSLRKYLISLEERHKSAFNVHIMPFIKLEDITKILQLSGFKQIITDIDTIDIEYKNPLECMMFIKNMCENAAFKRNTSYTISKEMFKSLLKENACFRTQFEIITIVCSV